MQPKHILIIFWDLGLGGIQKRIVDISHRLGTGIYGEYRATILVRNKPRFRLDRFIDRRFTTIVYAPTSKHKGIRMFRFFWAIFSVTFGLKPAVILTFLDMPSVFSVLTKYLLFWQTLRVVISEETFPSRNTRSQLKRFLIRTLYPHADGIIVQTHAVKRDLMEVFDIPKRNITIIPAWIPSRLERFTGKKPPAFDLLYAGRFEAQKDLFFLLEGVNRLAVLYPALSVYLIGEGSEENGIRAFIRENGLGQAVAIRKSIYDVTPFMAQAKLFVLTSRYEGMPLTLLEAMAAKKPSIVRRYPGVDECVINRKTAISVDTPEEFARNAYFLLRNPSRQRKMGEAACVYVQKHFPDSLCDRFLHAVIG